MYTGGFSTKKNAARVTDCKEILYEIKLMLFNRGIIGNDKHPAGIDAVGIKVIDEPDLIDVGGSGPEIRGVVTARYGGEGITALHPDIGVVLVDRRLLMSGTGVKGNPRNRDHRNHDNCEGEDKLPVESSEGFSSAYTGSSHNKNS